MALAVPEGEDPSAPIPAFSFYVAFDLEAYKGSDERVLGGFSDVTGLEATMEPKVIAEGGRHYGPHQRVGAVTFATVVLKRGMIESRHLWGWWSLFAGGDGQANGGWGPASRCTVTIALMRSGKPVIGWKLERAMPVKFRIGDLNARGTELAIEELHLAHEGLKLEKV